MFKKALSISICFMLIISVFPGCSRESENQKITFVLDWTPNTNHTGIYVAKEFGYYEELGIDIEIIQPPEDGALALIASGKADFAVSFEEEVLIAANAKQPLPIVAIASLVEHNTGGIISLKKEGITRFKDMEGKTFASWQIPIYDEIVRECIKNDGGNPDNVTFVPNSATDVINGLKYDYDTVWVYEGWEKIITDVEGVETNFFTFREANPIFDYYTPVLVCNQNMLDTGEDIVNKFLEATKQGYTYAKDYPRESAGILVKYAPETDSKIIYDSQEFLSTQYFSSKWGYIDEERWMAFFDWLKEKKLLDEDANTKAFKNIS